MAKGTHTRSRSANRLPQPNPDLTGARYAGHYHRGNEHLLIREGDGLRLLAKKRGSRWAIVEPDGGPYVSAVFTDNGHNEIEARGVRYRILPPEASSKPNRVEIRPLRIVQRRKARGPRWIPTSTGGAP